MTTTQRHTGSDEFSHLWLVLFILLIPLLLAVLILVVPVFALIAWMDALIHRRAFRKWRLRHQGEVILCATSGKRMNKWVAASREDWDKRVDHIVVFQVHERINQFDGWNLNALLDTGSGFPMLLCIDAHRVYAVSLRDAYRDHVLNALEPEFFWQHADAVLREWEQTN